MDKTIIIFSTITLVNVVLSTAKSILTVRASRETAALINAISYGFYSLVVKQMATVSTETVVIVTVMANLIGVYFSMWLLDKFKKDMFWKITVIPEIKNFENIRRELIENDLGFNEYKVNTKYGNQMALDIFSQTQYKSKKIKSILDSNGRVKYHIQEIKNQL
ncbi:MAG TPA: hypothetical protein GXZ90_01205 [Clostridiales bacterium]|nr:hypothetical protein [Clostridiales bacterium]